MSSPREAAEIAHYAQRKREDMAAAPQYQPKSWETRPNEFSLLTLDKIGTAPRPPIPDFVANAIASAGHNARSIFVMPVDFGILAYQATDGPLLHRETPISNKVDYIQPFIEVILFDLQPYVICIEIAEPSGVVCYMCNVVIDRGQGRATVLPSTRMSLKHRLMINVDHLWSCRMYANSTLIAVHPLRWFDPDQDDALVRHLAEDGELSVDLAALLAQVYVRPMSLNELLDAPDAKQSAS